MLKSINRMQIHKGRLCEIIIEKSNVFVNEICGDNLG